MFHRGPRSALRPRIGKSIYAFSVAKTMMKLSALKGTNPFHRETWAMCQLPPDPLAKLIHRTPNTVAHPHACLNFSVQATWASCGKTCSAQCLSSVCAGQSLPSVGRHSAHVLPSRARENSIFKPSRLRFSMRVMCG